METLTARVLSVNICQKPEQIGLFGGKPMISGIQKSPHFGMVEVGELGIIGDIQRDKRVHGGPDKAVYAYPIYHLNYWRDRLRKPMRFGVAMGENLTISDVTEGDVCIGDQWRWGEVLLEVTKPRQPCNTLEVLHDGLPMRRLMKAAGNCGWYFKVLETGVAEPGSVMTLQERTDNAPTVLEAFMKKVRATS